MDETLSFMRLLDSTERLARHVRAPRICLSSGAEVSVCQRLAFSVPLLRQRLESLRDNDAEARELNDYIIRVRALENILESTVAEKNRLTSRDRKPSLHSEQFDRTEVEFSQEAESDDEFLEPAEPAALGELFSRATYRDANEDAKQQLLDDLVVLYDFFGMKALRPIRVCLGHGCCFEGGSKRDEHALAWAKQGRLFLYFFCICKFVHVLNSPQPTHVIPWYRPGS